MEKLIDTHAHLSHTAFSDSREAVAVKALSMLDSIIDIATDQASALSSLALSTAHDRIYSTIGVHPHEARLYGDAELTALMELAHAPKVVAVGEVGLDYHYNFSSRDDQVRVLDWQAAWAKAANRPLVIHIREAFDDAFQILSVHGISRGVLHCFTGSWEQAKRALDMGLHLGFTGVLTFKNSEELREVARRVPLDRLLVETDCPYLAPHPHRKTWPNTPEMVEVTAALLASIRGMNFCELVRTTSENARRLFGLPERPGPEHPGKEACSCER